MGSGPVDWVGRVLPEAKFEEEKMHLVFFKKNNYLSYRYQDICKRCLGTSSMGWGPVDWVGKVLPEAKFENKTTLFFEEKNYLSDRYRDICKNGVWGPVEWVGDQLTGWGGSSQKQNSKIEPPCFLNFFDLSDRY